jgi:hypothetical protein
MINMKKIITLFGLLIALIRLQAQTTTSFNFSSSSHTVSGWTNIAGDPSTGVRSGSSGGITVSSIATANWVPIPGTGSAFDGVGASGGTFFPSGVMSNHWFQYSNLGEYNAAVPQLQISGLNKDSVYTVKMTGSSTSSFGTNPTQYTVAGKTVDGYIDVNTHSNTANGATFNNIAPDTNGVIHVYINTVPSTDVGDICGIQITPGHTTPPPMITITSPDNNDVLSEESNVTINAVASESGGSIVKVQFFVGDTTKIGESTTAPYSATWTNPDEGNYKITATAVDANGVSNSVSINISVESLNGFWSTTGNIAMNPSANFVGNVDSVRLAFRTKNIERMSISPTGNVGIGTTTPAAQLHTTGAVRLAGLTGDSTKNRVLVSDTSGNLFYRNVSSLSNRWQFAGTTVFDSADNIAIGTSTVPSGYKLAVNGTAIFTKVRVKTAGTWPDYVFKKGYVLPDLNQLERYIAAHKHLPGIVPEEEANRDGVDVGDHQAALLQKIEELTLYLIQQNKTLKAQQQEIDELKKLIRKGN